MKKRLNVGIIGAGVIGGKRAEAILKTKKGKLAAVADPDFARAKAFGEKYKIEAYGDWKELVVRPDIDAVIVAVPGAFAAKIAIAALRHKKHVLCEKPFGINSKESRAILAAAKASRRLVKVGFNHRFHEAIAKAKKLFDKGAIGDLIFMRARYGHGGRPGMEKEWRMNPKISGGGELLDQGAHIVDLMHWFGGSFKTAYGRVETRFWKSKVDDNAFAILSSSRVTGEFHVSTTQWKNLFSFEIYGTIGYLQIDGKGGSYGEQALIFGKRNPGLAPTLKVFNFGLSDNSWEEEWKNFTDAIIGRGEMIGSGKDGLHANEVIEALHQSSKTHREVKLK
jgi:predicted dehydrogenase